VRGSGFDEALSRPNPAVAWTDPSGLNFEGEVARAEIGPKDSLEFLDAWWPKLVEAPSHLDR
jgi:hypothetical protein